MNRPLWQLVLTEMGLIRWRYRAKRFSRTRGEKKSREDCKMKVSSQWNIWKDVFHWMTIRADGSFLIQESQLRETIFWYHIKLFFYPFLSETSELLMTVRGFFFTVYSIHKNLKHYNHPEKNASSPNLESLKKNNSWIQNLITSKMWWVLIWVWTHIWLKFHANPAVLV